MEAEDFEFSDDDYETSEFSDEETDTDTDTGTDTDSSEEESEDAEAEAELEELERRLLGSIEQEPDFPVTLDDEEDEEEAELLAQLAAEEAEAESEFSATPTPASGLSQLPVPTLKPAPKPARKKAPTPTLGPAFSNAVLFYKPGDPYGEFSNYWDTKDQKKKYGAELILKLDGYDWSSTEEYYHSQKFITQGDLGTNYIQFIRAANTQNKKLALGNQKPGRSAASKLDPKVPAYDAFTIGKIIQQFTAAGLTIRPDWEAVKVSVMDKAVRAKFTQNSVLKNLLLSTGDKLIAENSPRDSFWGLGKDGNGRNELGKILMTLRSELSGVPVPTTPTLAAPVPTIAAPTTVFAPTPAPTTVFAPTPAPTPTPELAVDREADETEQDYSIRKAFSEQAFRLLYTRGLDVSGAVLVGRCFLNMSKMPGLEYDSQIMAIIQYVKANT